MSSRDMNTEETAREVKAVVAAGTRHGVEEDDPEEVARILADQLEAVVDERDDVQAQLEESERGRAIDAGVVTREGLDRLLKEVRADQALEEPGETAKVIDLDAHRPTPGSVWTNYEARCVECGHTHIATQELPEWALAPVTAECPSCGAAHSCLPQRWLPCSAPGGR